MYGQSIRFDNNREGQKNLIYLLKEFENKHSIKFSYDVAKIEKIRVTVTTDSLSLAQLKDLLRTQTLLRLQKIDQQSYVITQAKLQKWKYCAAVVDVESLFPLGNVSIYNEEEIVAKTDNQGNFYINISEKDVINLYVDGYKEVSFSSPGPLKEEICDTIFLQPTVELLQEVIVQDYLTSGVQKNEDGSIELSTKKLRILPGLVEPDVLTSVQLLPGITSPTEDAARLFIRGGNPGENLILYDGIKMYQSGHLFDQISAFNPYILDRTLLYKGGTSVRYGDRISGVVDITTKDPTRDSLRVGGGINLSHIDVFFSAPVSQNVGVLAAIRRSTTDLYSTITTVNLVEKVFQNTRGSNNTSFQNLVDDNQLLDQTNYLDGNLKVLWNLSEKEQLRFSSIFAETNLNINSALIDEDENIGLSMLSDNLKNRNLGLGLNYCKKTDRHHQELNIYGSFFDQNYMLDDDNEAGLFTKEEINELLDLGAEYNMTFYNKQNNFFKVGYQFSYNETKFFQEYIAPENFEDNFFFSTASQLYGETYNHTLFASYTWDQPNWYTSLGIRNSYLTNTKSLFLEPRIFSSFKLNKSLRITASAELKNQQIFNVNTLTQIEFYSPNLPVSSNNWFLANSTDLLDEEFGNFGAPVLRSQQLTLGALYTKNGWNLDVEGYYKQLSNINLYTLINFPITLSLLLNDDFEEVNGEQLGEEKRFGIEVLLKKTIQNYRFWVGYALSKNQIDYDLIQEDAFASLNDQRHILNISQTLKVKNFEFALGYNFSTGRPFTQVVDVVDDNGFLEQRNDPAGISSNRFSDYHRVDVSALYRYRTPNKVNFLLGFSLRNILNRANQLSQDFITVQDDELIFRYVPIINTSLSFTPDFVFRIFF